MRRSLAVIIVALALATTSSALAAPNGNWGPHGRVKDGPIGWIVMTYDHVTNRHGYVPVQVPNALAPNGKYYVDDADVAIYAGCYVGRDSTGAKHLLSNVAYNDGTYWEFPIADLMGTDKFGNEVYVAIVENHHRLVQHLYTVPTFVRERDLITPVSFTNITAAQADVQIRTEDWQHTVLSTFKIRGGNETVALLPEGEYTVSWSDMNQLLPQKFRAFCSGIKPQTSVYGKPVENRVVITDRRNIPVITGLADYQH